MPLMPWQICWGLYLSKMIKEPVSWCYQDSRYRGDTDLNLGPFQWKDAVQSLIIIGHNYIIGILNLKIWSLCWNWSLETIVLHDAWNVCLRHKLQNEIPNLRGGGGGQNSHQNSQWSNPTCYLSHADNTMPADALATLGARALAGMVLTPKLEYSVSSIRRVNVYIKPC